MKKYLLLVLCQVLCICASAGNFVIKYGESIKLYTPRAEGTTIDRADRLFTQDYQEVFGEYLVHTSRMEDARIIACTCDDDNLKRYAKMRGINFNALTGHKEAFILKVHNNGTQLFVVGSDALGLAYGLMTLSRIWGVSPFRWWADAPALPLDKFELGVAYEHLFEATIPKRTLILNGAQEFDNYLSDMLLRLRANGITNSVNATAATDDGVFRWVMNPAVQPYFGLSLALDHPERICLEALRAYDHGHTKEWQFYMGHQLGGELQLGLFFDMAWDLPKYYETYSVDNYEDQHYTQMSGLPATWSQMWNDYFDLVMFFHPEDAMSFEALRRGIGESQSLALQLSLELNDKVVAPKYADSFFRTVEYPLNMTTTQMQRLCNVQLAQHGLAQSWAVDDCYQRMQLLAGQLPEKVASKWRQMMGAVQLPAVVLNRSLMQVDNYRVSKLVVGDNGPLPADESTSMLYRSKRAVGTYVEPFEPMRMPIDYQTDSVHLCLWFLPTRSYGEPLNCMVTMDGNETQLVTIDQKLLDESRQVVNLVFPVSKTAEKHEVVLRTTCDGIYLQRAWVTHMKQ